MIEDNTYTKPELLQRKNELSKRKKKAKIIIIKLVNDGSY